MPDEATLCIRMKRSETGKRQGIKFAGLGKQFVQVQERLHADVFPSCPLYTLFMLCAPFTPAFFSEHKAHEEPQRTQRKPVHLSYIE